jgi:hypothetical protein
MVANPRSELGSMTDMLKDNKVRQLITQLAPDNSNQAEFTKMTAMAAQRLNATMFTRKAYNIHKGYQPSTRHVKTEAKTKSAQGSASKSSSDFPSTPGKRSSVSAGASDDDSDASSNEEDVMDDVEALINAEIFTFVDLDGNLEAASATTTRMKFFEQLVVATPHHKRKTRNVVVGNCYGYMRAVLTGVTTTGQSGYKSICGLSGVRFTSKMTISDLDTELREV